MSWAEVYKINSDMKTPLNELISYYKKTRFYFYSNTSFRVPFDTKLTIRCNGAGGNGSLYCGGAGGGYSKDVREYKKGDVINITVAEAGTSQAVCSARGLSMYATAGDSATSSSSSTAGGSASGGNTRNVSGGTGYSQSNGGSSTYGCGAGGGYKDNYSYAGGNGGFSGGSSGISEDSNGSNGGTGGFSGGHGGAPVIPRYNSNYYVSGNGGDSQYGIGGNGGCCFQAQGGDGGNGKLFGGNGGYTSSSDVITITSGNGGNGIIPGLAGVFIHKEYSGTGYVSGEAGQNGSQLSAIDFYNAEFPKKANHGGGGGAYGTSWAPSLQLGFDGKGTVDSPRRGIDNHAGGIACCMITIGEDTEGF